MFAVEELNAFSPLADLFEVDVYDFEHLAHAIHMVRLPPARMGSQRVC